jgi:hypothetical protein
MMKRYCLLLIFSSLFISRATAQNPIIRDQFTADPTARVFNNKVYLFPSHDILVPEGARKDWFCMADYHVFSSENLTEWTDHGVIVSQEDVPWGNPTGYSMWAPDCVEKGGKYYFYFPNGPKGGRGFAIGVATADLPEGPYRLEEKPIVGVSGIDPCVLVDNDGQAYIYWSGMGIRGAKLKDNMKELDGELQEVKMQRREGAPEMPPMKVGGQQMEGLPDGFKEGPYVFHRGDWYYLTFPWVRQEGGTETLAYAMSHSPLGPWDFKGIIMAEHANRCWTNHHSLLEYRGQWYLFYHHNDFSPRDDKRRSARIEKIGFNTDGTIQEVKPTLRGVGILPATSRVEVDRYSDASNGVTYAYNDTANTFLGWHATLPGKGSWLRFADVDFSAITDGYVIAKVKAEGNTEVIINAKGDKKKGKEIARLKVAVSGAQGPFRRSTRGQWLTLTAPLTNVPNGVADVEVLCGDSALSVDWLQFKNRQQYFTPVDKKATAAQPDDRGFIRRWRLMEPQKQDIRSNTIFTDSWLRETFAKELAKLPKQKAKWYSMESPTYNMKLFHFAEKYGSQAYGNLFWCETVVNCAEEISDIRLAAGSNGASMWWLNGEEVLLLEGDRRMVVDDGVSKRLTLKKGRNTLRGAVINGPGLSDMCIRFIDEQGKPVKGYDIEN